jgi:NAD(P)-dependent dehydrogenase (short-subunit alcohol dehydrogenase family)
MQGRGALDGRSLIVTGASSGIGRAIAARCAAEGARVLAVGRNAGALHALAAERGERIVPHVADLELEGAGDGCVAAARERLGGLDGLVHAAGSIRRNEDPRTTTDAQFVALLESNLVATFRVTRPALDHMMAAGRGAIVLLGSQLAHVAGPGYASYCASKGGVTALGRALAVDAGPYGVRVNVLAPGVVHTPMAYVDRAEFDDLVPELAARHPLRRIGQPQDLAGPAVFLLSDDAGWMTGQTLIVDGGFTAQ